MPGPLAAVVTPDVHDDDDDDPVLRLLEESDTHRLQSMSIAEAKEDITADLSVVDGHSVDLGPVTALHDATSHQAQAAAALQHLDTEQGPGKTRQDSPATADLDLRQHGQARQKQQYSKSSASSAPIAQTLSSLPTSQTSAEISDASALAAVPTATHDSMHSVSAAQVSAVPAISPQAICLCQAPARIPRPRNAFILFRQHHHASVVAQNPGKPNPEISKIIGQMWKQSLDDVKSVWQGHADEEKRQHLVRYPQYRYQPRRNGKKNAAAVAAAVKTDILSTSIEVAVCPNCGGRTGALSAPQTSAATRGATKSTRGPPARRRGSPDDAASRITAGSGSPIAEGIDQAGVEALLQLGGLQAEEDMQQSPSKRRKLNESSPVMSNASLPQHSLYMSSFGHTHDPNIDPYLRHSSFESNSPSAVIDREGSMGSSQPQLLLSHYTDSFGIKSIPMLKKIHAIATICPALSSSSFVPRLPVVCVEGDDLDAVAELCHALSREIAKTELVLLLDEADELAVFDLDTLLNTTDRDSTDAECANYLTHVAFWRRKAAEIRKTVYGSHTQSHHSPDEATRQAALVLINRYILSRSETAAVRLTPDGLTPYAHWQWCTSIWKGCIGADVTIFVQPVPEGSALDNDAVESKESGRVIFARKTSGVKEWEDKVIRRLGFEIGEVIRSLRGFA